MYSTPVDLSFSYLCSAVEASLDVKKDQVDPNSILYLLGMEVCTASKARIIQCWRGR
jgi:hypothetical protein